MPVPAFAWRMPLLSPECNIIIRGVETVEISEIGSIVIDLFLFRSEESVAGVRHRMRALFHNPMPLDQTATPDQPAEQSGLIRLGSQHHRAGTKHQIA